MLMTRAERERGARRGQRRGERGGGHRGRRGRPVLARSPGFAESGEPRYRGRREEGGAAQGEKRGGRRGGPGSRARHRGRPAAPRRCPPAPSPAPPPLLFCALLLSALCFSVSLSLSIVSLSLFSLLDEERFSTKSVSRGADFLRLRSGSSGAAQRRRRRRRTAGCSPKPKRWRHCSHGALRGPGCRCPPVSSVGKSRRAGRR
eukprot:SAG11_NODE_9662_length_891_cov_1.340909_1_plen_202_part_01